jgi:hypothetical protein
MTDLQKIRFITANYSRLQGLKAVPTGLLLFLVSLWTNSQTGKARDLTLPLLWFAAAIGLYALIDWYYRKAIGRVEQPQRSVWADVVFSMVGAALVLGAFAVDMKAFIPVSVFAFVFALELLLDYVRMTRLAGAGTLTGFPPALFCAVSIALSGFLPLLGEKAIVLLGFRSPIFLVFAVDGILIVLYGLAGHFFLVRSISSLREADHGPSL